MAASTGGGKIGANASGWRELFQDALGNAVGIEAVDEDHELGELVELAAGLQQALQLGTRIRTV